MWTRNYKNILFTGMTVNNIAINGTSPGAFGEDGYYFNFKSTNGNIYEIANASAQTSSAYDYQHITPGRLLRRSSSFYLSSSLVLLTSEIASQSSANQRTDTGVVYIAFGGGGTAATELDYKLESIISSVQNANASTCEGALNTDGTITVNYSFKLNATADIVIKEIGLYVPVCYYGNSASSYIRTALINRIVLDNAVSVANGDSATITFSVTTPKITFSE